ncbi:MAG TPA: hypothetical protein VM056_06995 [Terriglobales bacterium]|nr:hypothetical protein [Terriglobales bacterium]
MKSRIIVLCLVVVTFLGFAVGKAALYAAPSSDFDVKAGNVQPRQLEEATQAAISREYSQAWQNLVQALRDNRVDLLQENFVGVAKDKFTAQIEKQKAAGISTNLVDRGHKVEVLFYSPEGSAIQFRDTASFDMQLLEGGKVIHTEKLEMQYVGLITVTGDRWKVRVLQSAK